MSEGKIPVETLLMLLLREATMINATANTLLLMGAEILARMTDSDVEEVTQSWLQVKEQFFASKASDLQDDLSKSSQ